MRDQIVGQCSICGGRVLQYSSLCIVGPWPPAECECCGAQACEGPVVPMRPRIVGTQGTAGNTAFAFLHDEPDLYRRESLEEEVTRLYGLVGPDGRGRA